jgi:hypothetical protein
MKNELQIGDLVRMSESFCESGSISSKRYLKDIGIVIDRKERTTANGPGYYYKVRFFDKKLAKRRPAHHLWHPANLEKVA